MCTVLFNFLYKSTKILWLLSLTAVAPKTSWAEESLWSFIFPGNGSESLKWSHATAALDICHGSQVSLCSKQHQMDLPNLYFFHQSQWGDLIYQKYVSKYNSRTDNYCSRERCQQIKPWFHTSEPHQQQPRISSVLLLEKLCLPHPQTSAATKGCVSLVPKSI